MYGHSNQGWPSKKKNEDRAGGGVFRRYRNAERRDNNERKMQDWGAASSPAQEAGSYPSTSIMLLRDHFEIRFRSAKDTLVFSPYNTFFFFFKRALCVPVFVFIFRARARSLSSSLLRCVVVRFFFYPRFRLLRSPGICRFQRTGVGRTSWGCWGVYVLK